MPVLPLLDDAHMSYSQMAEQLGLTYCRGITPIGHYCQLGDHKVGFVVGDTIHSPTGRGPRATRSHS